LHFKSRIFSSFHSHSSNALLAPAPDATDVCSRIKGLKITNVQPRAEKKLDLIPDFMLQLSLTAAGALFTAAAAVIGLAGWRLAAVAKQIAVHSGLGEALAGAIFLGSITSLSGTVTSVTAAAAGHPELAFSNAIGGIAAQTAFLAIADITYRRANLEHAAASVANVMMCAFLVTLLGLILAAMSAPEVAVLGLHPVSFALPLAYVFGMRIVSQASAKPMWRPENTPETRTDTPSERRVYSGMTRLWVELAVLAGLIGAAGWIIANSSVVIALRTGMSETAVGAIFSAVSTSLPELVTCIAAVRQGALTLAVGDIIGGNVFDTLFITLSDAAYRDGSILHAVGTQGVFVTALAVLVTGVMLMGMVRREKSGIVNIGFESFLVLLLYAVGLAVMLFT
jgi:cation:H+ antiporter